MSWKFYGANGQQLLSGDVGATGTTGTQGPTGPPDAATEIEIDFNPNLLSDKQAEIETAVTTTDFEIYAATTSFAYSTEQAHAGTHSLKMTASGASMKVGTLSGTSGFPCIPGHEYTARAWVRAYSTTRTVYVEMYFYDVDGTELSYYPSMDGIAESSSVWTEGLLTGIAPANAATVMFLMHFASSAAAEVHYADTLSIVDSAPSTYGQFDVSDAAVLTTTPIKAFLSAGTPSTKDADEVRMETIQFLAVPGGGPDSEYNPGSTAKDGEVAYIGAGLSWAAITAHAGNTVDATGTTMDVVNISGTAGSLWDELDRCIICFDTSGLPNGATIVSAVLSLYGTSKSDGLGITPSVNIYAASPANPAALVAGDYATLGSTIFCDTAITYARWLVGGYNTFELNAAGLAAISKTGVTKFGTRNPTYDVAGTTPTWSAASSKLQAQQVDYGSNEPKLVVTYLVDGQFRLYARSLEGAVKGKFKVLYNISGTTEALRITGATGPTGPSTEGLPGIDGGPGTTGPTGPTGPEGIPGQDGMKGSSGATGSTGPPNSPDGRSPSFPSSTGTVNNWNPGVLSMTNVIEWDGVADLTITGLMAQIDGFEIVLAVECTTPYEANTISLIHESASSDAANRFYFPNETSPFVIGPFKAVKLVYRLSRWQLVIGNSGFNDSIGGLSGAWAGTAGDDLWPARRDHVHPYSVPFATAWKLGG